MAKLAIKGCFYGPQCIFTQGTRIACSRARGVWTLWLGNRVIGEARRLLEAYHFAQQSSLTELKMDIKQGMADVKAAHVVAMDIAATKA